MSDHLVVTVCAGAHPGAGQPDELLLRGQRPAHLRQGLQRDPVGGRAIARPLTDRAAPARARRCGLLPEHAARVGRCVLRQKPCKPVRQCLTALQPLLQQRCV